MAYSRNRIIAEPLEKTKYPVDKRHLNGLSSQLVVIRMEDIDRVDWEVRDEKACWLLRLPEMPFIDGKKYHFQPASEWQYDEGTWAYQDAPIRNLLGCWKDGQLRDIDENERPIVGTQSAKVESDDLGVHYTITVKNTSDRIWKDVYFWVCFNHYHLPATGYRPFLEIDGTWRAFQDIPGIKQHCYFSHSQRFSDYEKSLINKPASPKDYILSFPGVVNWNVTHHFPLLTCHYSNEALAAGANQLWPCSDLFIWFGDVMPEMEVSKKGHIVIAQSDFKLFKDNILESLNFE